MWLTFRLTRDGDRGSTVALWVVTGAAGLLTHYFFAFVWAAAGSWWLLYTGRSSRRTVVWSGLATLLLVLPWYVRAPESLAAWRVTAGWLEHRPPGFSTPTALLLQPWRYVSLSVGSVGATRWNIVSLGVFVALAAAFALAGGLKRWPPSRQLVLLWLAAACLGPWLCDLSRGTYTLAVPRYALSGLPAACLLVGVALSRLRPGLAAIFAAAIALVFGVGLSRQYQQPSRQYEPFRETGAWLAREATERDLVVAHSVPSGVAGLARSFAAARPPGPEPLFAAWTEQLGLRTVPEDLFRAATGRQRVFYVDLHAVTARSAVQDWLEAHASLVAERRSGAATVKVFAPPEGAPSF
jgi:hypothetical protein